MCGCLVTAGGCLLDFVVLTFVDFVVICHAASKPGGISALSKLCR